MLEWHRLQCARVRRSCQTERIDDGKWVTLQRMTVGRDGMEKWIRTERAHISERMCERNRMLGWSHPNKR